MKRLAIFLTIIFLFVLNSVAAPDSLFKYIEQGNRLYDSARYDEAIEQYKKVLRKNYHSAELYYNIANAYFKTGDFPNAILYYEKALKLKPYDKKAKENLSLTRQLLFDKENIDDFNSFFLEKIFISVVNLLNSNTWAVISLLFFILALTTVIVFYLSKKISVRRTVFFSGIFFIIIFVFSLWFSIVRYRIESKGIYAIVMEDITVKSSPNRSGTDIYSVPKGTKVKILDKNNTWLEVKLANGKTGWIESDKIQKI